MSKLEIDRFEEQSFQFRFDNRLVRTFDTNRQTVP